MILQGVHARACGLDISDSGCHLLWHSEKQWDPFPEPESERTPDVQLRWCMCGKAGFTQLHSGKKTWQHFQALMPGASVKLMRVGGTLAWTSHAYQSDHSSQVVAHGEREH